MTFQASSEAGEVLEDREPDCDHHRLVQFGRLQLEEGLLSAGNLGCWRIGGRLSIVFIS
jgi:hypothetical protein